jgi:hypothetical protein
MIKAVSAAFLSGPWAIYDTLQSIPRQVRQIVEAQHGQ